MLSGKRLAGIAGVAVVLVSVSVPSIARDLRIGGAATVGAALPGTGADVGIGAGAGAAWNGGTDSSVGADGRVTTSAATLQSNGSPGAAALGLDRFAVQGDGKTNVSVFYKVLKTHF